jgi:hypothetical protein
VINGLARARTIGPDDVTRVAGLFGWVHAAHVPQTQHL